MSAALGVLAPAEWIYKSQMQRRRAAMLQRRSTEKAPCPILSIGNLTVGGTGKTPAVQWAARFIREEGVRVAIVSRGYGGSLSAGGAVVSKGEEPLLTAAQAGDEPVMHARSLPGVSVVIGLDRHEAARRAVEECGAEVIILDDGFQFWSLPRAFDLVLMDARRPLGNGHLTPAGPLREEPEALGRADGILLTRADLASPAEVFQNEQTLKRYTKAVFYQAEHKPLDLWAEHTQESYSMLALRDKPFLLLSAIADNEGFRRSLENTHLKVVQHVAKRDHHHWTAAEVQAIAAPWSGQIAGILTTEKDATKINPAWLSKMDLLWNGSFALVSLRIGLQIRNDETLLRDLIWEKLTASA